VVQELGERRDIRDVGAKNGGWLQGMERGEIQRRRKHPAFAGVVMRGASRPAQIAATGKHNKQLKVFRICRKFTPLRKLEPLSGEVLARAK
jgi:hypothetical protein